MKPKILKDIPVPKPNCCWKELAMKMNVNDSVRVGSRNELLALSLAMKNLKQTPRTSQLGNVFRVWRIT